MKFGQNFKLLYIDAKLYLNMNPQFLAFRIKRVLPVIVVYAFTIEAIYSTTSGIRKAETQIFPKVAFFGFSAEL